MINILFLVPKVFVSSVAVATASVYAENRLPIISQAAIELPSPPFLASWCEGKDCEQRYSKRLVCKTTLLADAKEDAKKVADLAIGDIVETRVYYTKVIQLGSYLPLEAPKQILVSELRPNVYVSFFDHAWDSVIHPPMDHLVKPKTEAWAFVKLKTGKTGFIKLSVSSQSNLKKGVCPFQLTAPYKRFK